MNNNVTSDSQGCPSLNGHRKISIRFWSQINASTNVASFKMCAYMRINMHNSHSCTWLIPKLWSDYCELFVIVIHMDSKFTILTKSLLTGHPWVWIFPRLQPQKVRIKLFERAYWWYRSIIIPSTQFYRFVCYISSDVQKFIFGIVLHYFGQRTYFLFLCLN